MMKWVNEVDYEVASSSGDVSAESGQWTKRYIYRLPAHVTGLDDKTYKPQVVSLGPYHHGQPHLKGGAMEEHKHRALLHFLKRCGKSLRFYVEALAQVVQELRDAYDQLDPKWRDDDDAFLKMMVVDGCFILELLRMDTDDYAHNDPLFSKHGHLHMLSSLKREMLLLENQVPLLLLLRLLAVTNEESGVEQEEYLKRLIVRFYFPGAPQRPIGKCLHLLDVSRKTLVYEDPRTSLRRRRRRRSQHNESHVHGLLPKATDICDAGVIFSNTSVNLQDITFRHGTLRLPALEIDTGTKSMLLNLIAYERFHLSDHGNEITSYVFFLNGLVRDSKDVDLLSSFDIIKNSLGSEEDVANLFSLLRQCVSLDPESSRDMPDMIAIQQLTTYVTRAHNKWRQNLARRYFGDPWWFITALLFILAVIQTVFSVLSYTDKK
ncbi:hypothetical protein Salat_1975300 [Sesamum alatum]|uniref:Uncharacterized protein n=1 Tax=Sesamum alatum TaxID=300844 RepID=A0AAE1Y566_9LAMI|nr:hypothetical protein Salat_1975300 [Sesamum alatum]